MNVFRFIWTYLKKLAISTALITQMYLNKKTSHLLPSQDVVVQVNRETSLEHSSMGKELLVEDTSYKALKKLANLKSDLEQLLDNSNDCPKKERCILKHLVQSIERITDDELVTMISLLESEDDFEV
jgi:hypothetical protein